MQGIGLGVVVPGGACDFRVGYPDTSEDLDFIESAFDHAREFMRANGNPTQWPSDYPNRSDALNDIERGACFLVCDEQGPLAVFSFARGPEEEYSQIDGAWHFDDPSPCQRPRPRCHSRGHGLLRGTSSVFTLRYAP